MRLNPDQISARAGWVEQRDTHRVLDGYRHSLNPSYEPKQRGFTLVELVITMVIIGILAAVAVPRFFDNNVFQSRGFADEVIASLRYAQKVAIAQHRFVCVTFPSTSRVVFRTAAKLSDTACNTDLQSPSGSYPPGQTTYTVDAPSGVTLNGGTPFNFDAQGRPSFAPPAVTIGVTGAASVITIEPETGYVH